MARRQSGHFSFQVDFKAMETAFGAMEALIETGEDEKYLDDLVQTAFNESEDAFNQEAAAFALTGGPIKHMYEWGTAGINRGRSSVRPNPMSPRARLWGTNLTGHGLNQTYAFYFKPSVGVVPKPTVADTGMSAEDISQLRDHVFWNKAMVFEMGQQVRIVPTQAKFLIQPFYKGRIPEGARNADIKRGYTVSKGPNVFTPGAAVQGNFTSLWTNYWNNQGEEQINASVEKQIRDDFEYEIEHAKSGPLRPPIPTALFASINKEKKRVERNARARARYRAKKDMTNYDN